MGPEVLHIVSPQQTPEEKVGLFGKLPKPKKPSPLVVILILIAAIALTATFYFANQIKNLKNQIPQVPPNPPQETSPESTTQVSDETANWKTYTNEEKNLSFKYPVNLYVITEADNSATNEKEILKIWKEDALLPPEPEYYFSLVSSTEEVENRIERLKSVFALSNIQNNSISLGGKTIEIMSGIINDGPSAGNILSEAYVPNSNKIYVFSDSGVYSDKGLFNQILSTLKFLD